MSLRNRVISRISHFSLAMLGLSVVLASTGCTPLVHTVAPESQPIPADSQTANSETYQVLMKGLFGKTTAYEGTINGPITVQTALEESGAIEKYRGMDIELVRLVDGVYRPLKMPVGYTHSTKTVRSSQDYSIHPNDRILITPQSNNLLDQVVDSVTGGAF